MVEESETPISAYVDSVRMTVTPYGASLTFGLNPPHPPRADEGLVPPEDQARLRMSLEHAKVLAMMLRKNLRAYETEYDLTIALPLGIYETLGLDDERASWDDAGAS